MKSRTAAAAAPITNRISVGVPRSPPATPMATAARAIAMTGAHLVGAMPPSLVSDLISGPDDGLQGATGTTALSHRPERHSLSVEVPAVRGRIKVVSVKDGFQRPLHSALLLFNRSSGIRQGLL